MGALLAIMVFVYPLAMPVATLAALLFVAGSLKLGVQVAAARTLVVLPVLMLLLAPGVASTVSGSFLLPWWLHVAVGHTGVRYYPLAYLLGCLCLLVLLCSVVLVWRHFARRSAPR